jgi:hypothetical protein
MKDALNGGLMFVVLAVAMSIGGAILVMSNTTVDNITNPDPGNVTTASTLMSNITFYAGQAVVTFVQFLPVLAIALVGGLALYYILSYVGGFGGRE